MCRACAEIFRRVEFNKTSFNEPRLVDGSRTHTHQVPSLLLKGTEEGTGRFRKNEDSQDQFSLVPRI